MAPAYIMLKPASGMCNMRCKYCFYADEMRNRTIKKRGMMSEQTLEQIISKALDTAKGEITFAYQGGEPTLRGLRFFEKAIELQKKYAPEKLRVYNVLQTNGYVINEGWCRFLRDNHFLVGLSLDGVMKTHDRNRVDENQEGTYLRCLKTAELFENYGVEFNILTVVNRQTVSKIQRIYQDYARKGFKYQQYIACLEPLSQEHGTKEYSLSPHMYGRFLVELFQMWYEDWKCGKQPYIRMFENYIGILLGYPPESCEQSGICGIQYMVEADGEVFPCDFYMLDDYSLGNLNELDFEEIDKNRKKIRFVEASAEYSKKCRECRYFKLCRGGCRRNRVRSMDNGECQNYFCEAYQVFFDAHYVKMLEIATTL